MEMPHADMVVGSGASRCSLPNPWIVINGRQGIPEYSWWEYSVSPEGKWNKGARLAVLMGRASM
jgi:hypothetical protein